MLTDKNKNTVMDKELWEVAPVELRDRYQEDVNREKRWRALVDRDNLFEEMKRNGFVRKDMRDYEHGRICLELMLDETEKEIRRKAHYYEKVAQALAPLLERTELRETMTTSYVAAFQTFAFQIVRELWPTIAPLAQMIGLQTMPLPTAKLFYLKTYYTDAGSFYSAGARLVNQNDPDYSDYSTEGSEPNEVHLKITGDTVTAVAKALLGRWSRFMQQDLEAYHQLSVQGEIAKLIAQQIAREQFGEVRNDLVGSASGGSTTWYTTPASGSIYTLDSAGDRRWYETLFDAIADVEQDIYDKVYRRVGWIWCDTETANKMNKAGRFEFRGDVDKASMGGQAGRVTEFYGTVDGKWQVYADPDAAANTCIVGVTPSSWLETGYILATYQPLAFTDVFEDPAELAPRMAGVTRYGKKGVNWAFYGKVSITARS